MDMARLALNNEKSLHEELKITWTQANEHFLAMQNVGKHFLF
jgi:hypothetical protein